MARRVIASQGAPNLVGKEAAKTRKRRQIPIRISRKLKTQLQERVIEDGYGSRGTSKWVREAFFMMIEHNRSLETVGIGDDMGDPIDDVLYVSYFKKSSFLETLDDKKIEFRLNQPLIEGVKSLFIRSAIRFRLDHPELTPGEEK